MTLEEIRKNAPDGATHYDHEVKMYIRLNGDNLEFWYKERNNWIPTHIMFLDIERCSVI